MIKSKLFYLLLVLVVFSSCESDDDGNATTSDSQNEISLDELSNGEGAVASTGAINLDWQGNAYWELTSTSLTSNGVSYYVWEVIMDGPTDAEYIRIQIVEEETSVSNDMPSDGIYTLGGSMDENDIQIYTNEGDYFFSLTSNGEFELTKNGDVLEITLEATDLESGGIGEDETFIDVSLAVKASSN
ncbi:MAG: hypothetical protein GVY05_11080 [Bacteroidetes bacterium]|jgi:hypothetical protein|nr:hypothetical protein [Bacteroidota bacterium]